MGPRGWPRPHDRDQLIEGAAIDPYSLPAPRRLSFSELVVLAGLGKHTPLDRHPRREDMSWLNRSYSREDVASLRELGISKEKAKLALEVRGPASPLWSA